MEEHIVTVAAENGQTTCRPESVLIGAGDTVQWICYTGDLVVEFDENPFTETQRWKAVRDTRTPAATVQPGLVKDSRFRPTITIGTNAAAVSLGDLIVR
jgi:plastocyanin